MRNILFYLFLGGIFICSCNEPKPKKKPSPPKKKFNNKKPFEVFSVERKNGKQFLFKGFEVTDQNAGAVAGIRVNLAFDFIHNGLPFKKLKKLLQFHITMEANGKEIYNPKTNPPTETQEYYYHNEQSELISDYRFLEEDEQLPDTLSFEKSVFIPYFRLDAPAGNLDVRLTLNLDNLKKAEKWGTLASVEATFDKPKTMKATFELGALNLNPLKKKVL
ncbi:MAG: hypothetical protein GY810_07675 [Aureispira sp.]|nr:hypothetical protein [Aureispira sp.]